MNTLLQVKTYGFYHIFERVFKMALPLWNRFMSFHCHQTRTKKHKKNLMADFSMELKKIWNKSRVSYLVDIETYIFEYNVVKKGRSVVVDMLLSIVLRDLTNLWFNFVYLFYDFVFRKSTFKSHNQFFLFNPLYYSHFVSLQFITKMQSIGSFFLCFICFFVGKRNFWIVLWLWENKQ